MDFCIVDGLLHCVISHPAQLCISDNKPILTSRLPIKYDNQQQTDWLRRKYDFDLCKEVRTLFLETRVRTVRAFVDLGTVSTKAELHADGLMLRLMEPGEALNHCKEDMVHVFAEANMLSVRLNGRLEGDLVVFPGARFHLVHDYTWFTENVDPFNLSEAMLQSMASVLVWQPWVLEQKALNFVTMSLGQSKLRLAHDLNYSERGGSSSADGSTHG
jgi:hypothetical protein